MSYQQFQQQCIGCAKTWNAAFGIVGTTQIAAPPTKCPYCGSEELMKIADQWEVTPVIQTVRSASAEQVPAGQPTLAWLIEGAEVYWGGRAPDHFEKDVNEAVRFAREEDALTVLYWLVPEPMRKLCRVASHMWCMETSGD